MSANLQVAETLEKIIEQIPGAEVEWEKDAVVPTIKITDQHNSVYTIQISIHR